MRLRSVVVPGRALLALLTAGMVVTALASPQRSAADQGAAEEHFQRTFSLHPGAAVVISNDRGKTTVEGWDKEQAVVDVVKHFEGSESERATWMRETEVRFEGDASRLQIKVEIPHHMCFGYCNWSGGVDLTVHVPRRVQLDLQSDRGAVRVAAIEGSARIRSDRGPITIEALTGGLHITSDRGSVRIRDADIRNELYLHAERGDIDFQGRGLAQGGTVAAERGNVRMRLPENVKLQVEAASNRRSRFRSDFPLSVSGKFGGSGTVRGSINGGGPTLRLKAERGSVWLEKGGRAAI